MIERPVLFTDEELRTLSIYFGSGQITGKEVRDLSEMYDPVIGPLVWKRMREAARKEMRDDIDARLDEWVDGDEPETFIDPPTVTPVLTYVPDDAPSTQGHEGWWWALAILVFVLMLGVGVLWVVIDVASCCGGS